MPLRTMLEHTRTRTCPSAAITVDSLHIGIGKHTPYITPRVSAGTGFAAKTRPRADAWGYVGACDHSCMSDTATASGSILRPLPILAAILCLATANAAAQEKVGEWRSLFDGKSLQGWRETPFTGRGQVRVENAAIVLGAGMPMTGVTWTGSFPHADYEVRLEGVRRQGNDFFASVTFPAGDSFCTWVTGGWGGDIVGLWRWRFAPPCIKPGRPV
jgi:hypothetical protein